MRIRFDQLAQHLAKGLKPIYLISGDEPLQVKEAADAIRKAAQQQGYTSRDTFEADARFDWNRLTEESNTLSLFAERRVLDLRIPSGKPGREGGAALSSYTERPPEDILLLITLPKLDKKQTNTKWLKRLEATGVHIQTWAIEGERLLPWIEQRMRSAGLIPEPDVVAMLADRIEGNLLAAVQEIDKLLLLQGPGRVSCDQLAEAVADSARYNVFDLVDSALQGKTTRALKMLVGLRAEGTSPALVIWAINRELRTLATLATHLRPGQSPVQLVNNERAIWPKRKAIVSQGLQRHSQKRLHGLLRLCSLTDRAIKGRELQEPWLLIRELISRLSGVRPIGEYQ